MKKPTNIILIETDQQRYDTIAAQGNPHMITPHLDRLVSEGISFTNAFCCGATCISSRAAMYTGQFPHNTGCYSFDEWGHNRTWLHEVKEAGFHTAAIGKVHHSPNRAMMAFDDRIFTENFPIMSGSFDDYANYLKAEGQESGCKLLAQDGKWMEKCVSDLFPMDEKYHVDQFVGRMAVRWIEDYNTYAPTDKPFYLHIGFQGPHDPFDPPERFYNMYKNREVPLPRKDKKGYDGRPPYYRRHMESILNTKSWDKAPAYGGWAADLRDKTDEDLARMRRHYYAEITQIDEQIGRILDALERKGALDNSLIIFTSDHGDNLGDHELLYKWLMTDQAIHVPFVVRLPEAERAGTVDNDLLSQIDVGPTILTALGLGVPQRLDGHSNWNRFISGDSSEAPGTVYCEDNYLTMIRTKDRKLITYAGQEHEEYFDLESDPWEEENLSTSVPHRKEILELKEKTLDWLMGSRYLGSLSHINDPAGKRKNWPANHPHDPWVLHPGMIGNNDEKL
jgi:arylsulfatase